MCRILYTAIAGLLCLHASVCAQERATSLDQSKMKFFMLRCDPPYQRYVGGVVAQDINLSSDDVAKEVMKRAVLFAQERCKLAGFKAAVELHYGDLT